MSPSYGLNSRFLHGKYSPYLVISVSKPFGIFLIGGGRLPNRQYVIINTIPLLEKVREELT